MKYFWAGLIMLLTPLFFHSKAMAIESRYQHISQDEAYDYYLDKESVTCIKNPKDEKHYLINTWLKRTPKDDYRKTIASSSKGIALDGYIQNTLHSDDYKNKLTSSEQRELKDFFKQQIEQYINQISSNTIMVRFHSLEEAIAELKDDYSYTLYLYGFWYPTRNMQLQKIILRDNQNRTIEELKPNSYKTTIPPDTVVETLYSKTVDHCIKNGIIETAKKGWFDL